MMMAEWRLAANPYDYWTRSGTYDVLAALIKQEGQHEH
jgi:hypothetical protein